MAINGNLKVRQSKPLMTGANRYRALGYSLIPTNGKIAAIPWKIYQSAHPTAAQLRQWFAPVGGLGGYSALAIVTGPISRLAVLDFDDRALYRQFCAQYRQLAATYTVQTRRGYHLYYRVPPGIQLSSRCLPGVDLQYQGKYVVAPPSLVDGQAYSAIQEGSPRTLSQRDWTTIGHFLDRQRFGPVPNPADAAKVAPNPQPEPARALAEQQSSLTGSDLAGMYRTRATGDGRNSSLFKLSCLGRDNGLSQDQIVAALANIHARQPARGDHNHESSGKRYREAARTIASAFSRGPRNGRHHYQEPAQLPNPVREALFQNQLTCAVRVIEGLRLKGIQVGQQFTKKQAVGLLKGVVGRDSVYNALNAVLDNGRPLFKQRKSPLATPLSPTAVAESAVPRQNSKCLELTLSKPGIVTHPRSRPMLFCLPGNRELAQKLGVKHSTISDLLTLEDLQGAKSSRTALHAGLIQRRPGQYSVAFFAGRLGLSERSIYRYNQEDQHIHCAPVYRDQALYWSTLETQIPPDPSYFPHDGVFLQDSQGKKYPPKRAIARKLLAAKKTVTLRTRQANIWWYGAAAMPLAQVVDHQALEEKLAQQAARGYRPHYEFPVIDPERRQPAAAAAPTSRSGPGRTVAREVPAVDGRQPLSDADREAAARRLKDTIDRLSQQQGKSLSIFSARRMLAQYGLSAVEHALQVTARRRNLHNPPGFLATLLRSEKRAGRFQQAETGRQMAQ